MRCYRILHRLYLCLLIIAGGATSIFAQQLVSFTPPEQISVCGDGEYTIIVENPVSGDIQLNLPRGFNYLPGSVSAGEELDLSDLRRPVFTMARLSGEQWQLSFSMRPDCEVYDRLNKSEQFHLTAIVDGQLIELPQLEVQTAFLVNESLPRLTLQSGVGRNIRIAVSNTRQGVLREARLEFTLSTKFQSTTAHPSWDMANDSSWVLEVDSSLLVQFGDGDELWEPGETLDFEFTLVYDGCLERKLDLPIYLKSWWGCDTLCQEDVEVGVVTLSSGLSNEPHIFMKIDTVWDPCFCEQAPSKICITLINDSEHDARDLAYFWSGIGQLWTAGVDTAFQFFPAGDKFGTQVSDATIPPQDSGSFLSNIRLDIPRLAAGDSIRWCMDAYYVNASNAIKYMGFSHRMTYRSSCPPYASFGIPQTRVDGPEFKVTSFLDIMSQGTIGDADIFNFDIELKDFHPRLHSGLLDITMTIPCGFTLQTTEFLLDGRSPVRQVLSGNVLHLQYAGVFDKAPYRIPVQLRLDCESIASCSPELGCIQSWFSEIPNCYIGNSILSGLLCVSIYHNPCSVKEFVNTCSPFSLPSLGIPFECEDLETCVDTVDMYALGDLSVRRISLGLEDADNDRIGDAFRKVDPSSSLYGDSLRLQRLVSSDSFELRFSGEIFTGIQIADSLEWHIDFGAGPDGNGGQRPDLNNLIGFVGDGNLDIIDGEIHCFDVDGRSIFTRELPQAAKGQRGEIAVCGGLSSGGNSERNVSISYKLGPGWLAKEGLSGFRLRSGYRLELRVVLRNHFNPLVTQDMVNYIVRDEVFLGNAGGLVTYSPGCREEIVQLVRTTVLAGAESRWQDGCRKGNVNRMFLFQMSTAVNNAFPYEYRNFYLPEEIVMPRLFDIDIRNAVWRLMHRDGLVEREFHRFPAVYQYLPGEIHFEFPESDSLWWDEHVIMVLEMDYDMELCLPAADSIKTDSWRARVRTPEGHQMWKSEDEGPFLGDISWNLPVNIRSARVDYNWLLASSLSTPESDTVAWTYNLIYSQLRQGMVMGFELSNDRFEWLGIDDEGRELGQIMSGSLYSLSDGAFNDTLSGLIRLKQLSCAPDSVWLRYGWRCAFNEEFCLVDSLLLFSRPQGVEFELQLNSPTAKVKLCEEFDYVEIWMYNADRGVAFSPLVEAELPQGLEYISGTCSYRLGGAANWSQGPDPVESPGLLRWDIAKLLGVEVLAAVDKAPENEIFIRFKTQPICGFVSGDQIAVKGTGYNHCGEIANSITRYSTPLEADTELEPKEISIRWTASDTAYICRENFILSWTLDIPDTSSPGDSIWIFVPPGVQIDEGNTVWSSGDPAVLLQDMPGQRGRIRLGIPAGHQQISLQIPVQFPASLACGSIDLRAQALSSGLVNCGNNSNLCRVFEVVATESARVYISQETLSLSDGQIRRERDGSYSIDFVVSKSGPGTSNVLRVCLINDMSPRGIWDANDSPVTEFNIPDSLWKSDSLKFSVRIPDTAQLTGCDPALVLKASENCICEDLFLPLNRRNEQIIRDSLCPGSIWHIGVDSLPGEIFSWENKQLPCSDCAQQRIVADGNDRIETLQVTDRNGCVSNYSFVLNASAQGPEPLTDTSICIGESIAYLTAPGYSGRWSGVGVTDPTANLQLIYPEEDGWLVFEGESAEGCRHVDSIRVTVHRAPELTLPDLLAFCNGESVIIDPDIEGDVSTFTWLPAQAFVDPGSIPGQIKPGAQPDHVSLYVQNKFGCYAADSTRLVIRQFEFEVDTASYELCEGDSVQISYPDSLRYRWVPGDGLDCDTCSTVIWSPGESTDVSLIVQDSYACADTALISFHVKKISLDSSEISICRGDTALFDGHLLTEAGRYDFRYDREGSCDSVHTVRLSYYDSDTIYIEGEDRIDYGDTARWTVIGGEVIRWEGPFEYLNCAECNPAIFTIKDSAEIGVLVRSPDGCEVFLRKKVVFRQEVCPDSDRVFVPNAFSPNGDNVNDVLLVRGTAQSELYFVVYNRWGQEVFSTRDPGLGWNGVFGGERLPPDVYSYYLELRCPEGEIIRQKGNVTIMP